MGSFSECLQCTGYFIAVLSLLGATVSYINNVLYILFKTMEYQMNVNNQIYGNMYLYL